MYDVNALEKKWKKYKNRQRLPWIGLAILVTVILISVIFREKFITMVSDKNKSGTHMVNVNKSAHITKESKNQINGNRQLAAKSTNDAESNQSAARKNKQPMMTIEVSESGSIAEKEHKRKYIDIEVTDRETVKSQKSLKPKKHRSIQSAEKHFAQSGSYYDALYLARSYYKKGQYRKAQKWALITNDLNSHVEESWLIFAKSKAKLGQKREAMEILAVYSRKTNSGKAQKLLNQMRQGKF